MVRPTVRYAQPKPTEDLTANGDVTPGSGNLWRAYNAPNHRRGVLGYELAQVATGTITHVAGGKVEVSTLVLDKNEGGREVRAGDRPVPVEARPYDLQFIPMSRPPVSRASTCACWPLPTCSPLVGRAT